MVPDATFTSYYGRQVVKATPWEADIPFYLFAGGLAGGSSLLGGGRRPQRSTAPAPQRPHRRDLARSRRACSRSSTTSGGRELLQHAPGVQADLADVGRHLDPDRVRPGPSWPARRRSRGCCGAFRFGGAEHAARLGRPPGGIRRPPLAPAVASYTAVLLTDTSTPAWHDAHRELPFVFVGSAAAASGGLGMVTSPLAETGPGPRARRHRRHRGADRRAPHGDVHGLHGRSAARRHRRAV